MSTAQLFSPEEASPASNVARPTRLIPVPARPRVLQVITSLNLGGAEEVALSLTEQLQDVCDFSVFAVMGVARSDIGLDMQRRLRELRVPVHVGTSLDMKRGGAVVAGQRLRRLLRQQPPDVLHLHTDIPDSTYAASTLFGPDAPQMRVLRTIHNTTLWPKWRRVGGWVECRLSGAEVVGVSPASLESLHTFRDAQRLPRLSAAQCRVIYNGVAGGSEAVARRPARVAGPMRVLFAGRLEPQKGADLLPAVLERAAQLTSQAASVQIYGHGSLSAPLERWAAATPLRWPVTLNAPVPQLAARLDEFDVVLMPSRFEGLAMLALEAVMSGTPLVGTEIAGLRELFPGGTELLAPAENVEELAHCLVRVIEQPEVYRAQAVARVLEAEAVFGVARMVSAYRQLYQTAPAAVAP